MGKYKNRVGKHITGERREQELKNNKFANLRDQPRDRKEVSEFDWSEPMYHCNSCCKAVPKDRAITYLFRGEKFRFCGDTCLAYYMGEFLNE